MFLKTLIWRIVVYFSHKNTMWILHESIAFLLLQMLQQLSLVSDVGASKQQYHKLYQRN